ncbi:MAG: bifunctional methylenetetrahydrofolate dehydrogenase/methenyltetrahydrofolate cyclohydrolase FolD [Clostridiales bacterium]|nr:MAG: bifunctional methylenetetrahydrofolate dehydrogenase/methenyltetrahydrofolate cyclohydrolase FolD [Clostridiales bacterium]
MSQIIDGKKISSDIREEIKNEVAQLSNNGIKPGLAVILVGNDSASKVYVNNKKKACEETGIYSEEYLLSEDTTEEELVKLIEELNNRPQINGILLQSPIPKHLDYNKIILHISPFKDVDAFHPYNVGKIMIGSYDLAPCTPAGVIELIKRSGETIAGKICVVVGRSNIVGKPMSMLLLHQNGTVTVCHSKTKNLTEITRNADILVAAIGKAEFITGDMIKPGATVIDVGMNRNAEGKLVGDVDFASASEVAGKITPVPGGVGPMTITMLLKNTLTAAKLQK